MKLYTVILRPSPVCETQKRALFNFSVTCRIDTS